MVETQLSSFAFETYGVHVRLSSNVPKLLDEAVLVARTSLLGNIRPTRRKRFDLDIELLKKGRNYILRQNGEEIARGTSRYKFVRFFDSVIRASVGEHSPDLVFVHAGAVGWKGKAILLPADSYQGKSTLVAEMVRQGATYLSDDFAIIDSNGLAHAFPRDMSLRTEDHREYTLTVESVGGTQAAEPLPVGLILFTGYKARARWRPVTLSAGRGLLELIPFTLTFRLHPEMTMSILKKATARAIIASGSRGNAKTVVPQILNFVDKNVN